MTKGVKGLIIFFAVCIVFTIVGIVSEVAMKDKKAAEQEVNNEAVSANYELIKEKLFNPETQKLDGMKAQESDTPNDLSNQSYVVIRSYVDGDNGSKWELNKSISELSDNFKPLTEKWSEEDLDKLPIIVIAVSHVRGKTYKYVTGGSGNVEITTESVNLYFYNTKTGTIFKTDLMPAHELPESTNSSHSYKKDLYDVSNQIKKNLDRFAMPSWLMGLLVIGGIFGIPIVIAIIVAEIKHRKNVKKEA